MKSALGAFVCVAAVYAGCSWFVSVGFDEWHLQASEENGGWIAVSEATLQSPFLQARRPETMPSDPYETRLSAARYEEPANRVASPWMARARTFDPASL